VFDVQTRRLTLIEVCRRARPAQVGRPSFAAQPGQEP
jgi:hypothetical protein